MRSTLALALSIILFHSHFYVHAQPNTPKKSLVETIKEAEDIYGIKIFYKEEWLDGKTGQPLVEKNSLDETLKNILANTQLNYIIYDKHYVVVLKTDASPSQQQATTEKKLVNYIITGKVMTEGSEETVPNATIHSPETGKSVTSDLNGYYQLTLPEGNYTFEVNSIGFHTSRFDVEINQDIIRDVFLFDEVIELEEVIVSSDALNQNISEVNMGKARLDIASIKKLPALMGEVDIVKGVLSLPGVQTVGEGATGFNVRGGSIDQNLILLDGAPIFNSSHVFGFFSIFNPDAVSDVTLYKGSIPAKFGGRLSSVLDVSLKEGNPLHHSVSGGIGLFAGRISLSGPIKKRQTTYAITGRTSYSDWALNLFDDPEIKNSSASFYDSSIKLSHVLGKKDKISVSGYLSADQFKFLADTTYDWSSQSISTHWNHSFSDRLYTSLLGAYSNYEYGVDGRSPENEFDWQAGIMYRAIKASIGYQANPQNKIEIGSGMEWYDFTPGSLFPIQNSSINPVELEDDFARNTTAYINHETKLTPRLSVTYGIRYSAYQNLGPGTSFTFQEDTPRRVESITDSLQFNTGDVIETFHGLEPRVSANYGISESESIKLSYNRMRQNIHLISNTTSSTPIDIWQTSNQNITPQIGDQYSIGYFRNFNDNSIETSAEAYYRSVNDLVEFKDGAEILLNRNIETDLVQGKGQAYGLELFLRKKRGLLSGWVAYTYSRTRRQVEGSSPEETINFGRYFPANFDKPHDLTIVATYQLTRRWSFNANFTYSTGRPVTLPSSKFRIGDFETANFSERNGGRIPNYHRLDLSITLDGNHRKNKKWQGSWTLSVYNVYDRDNAFSVFFRTEGNGGLPQAFKLAVIGTIFPSITYNFRFKA